MSHASDGERGYELVAAIAFGIGLLCIVVMVVAAVVAVVQVRRRRTARRERFNLPDEPL